MTTSIGVVFPAHAAPERLPRFAARVQELGYDELWVVEDCFLSGGMALAATALAVTTRLRVGVGLLPAAVRNPAITAMEIATLARMHPGRLSVAFGHGVEAWMEQIDARPARRVRALGEVVSAVRALLAGETLDVDGSFVRLSGVALDHPPAQSPEILIGTTGPAGMRLTGRCADGLLLPEGCGPRFVAQAHGALAEGSGSGGTVPEIVLYAWLRIGERDEDRAALDAAVAGWAGSGLYPGPTAAAGVPPGVVDVSTAHMPDLLDEVAVAGSPARCAAAVRRLWQAGPRRLVLVAVGEDPDEQYARFAAEVLPSVRTAGGDG